MESRRLCLTLTAVLGTLLAVAPARSEEVEKKWRVSLAYAGTSPVHDVESSSGNVLTLQDRQTFELVDIFRDPRDDRASFGNFDVNAGDGLTAAVQYALSPIFIVEASVGYQESDVGDVEVSVEFDNIDPPIEEVSFNYTTYRIPAGTMTRLPLRLSGIARFRPRAKFNPYVGGGIGYSIIGYDVSDELNDLSVAMDSSTGFQTRLSSAFEGSSLNAAGPPGDLGGADADFRDTFEWHLLVGAEMSFKRTWSAFLDVRWTDASRDVSIEFNGASGLGVGVPQVAAFTNSGLDTGVYGPVQIISGGLIDGGQSRWVPRDDADPQTNCDALPDLCRQKFFLGETDGEADLGAYYVQGGTVSLDGYEILVGVRYTFK